MMLAPNEQNEAMPVGLKTPWHKQLKNWLNRYEWQVVAVMWIVATVLGYNGFEQYYREIHEEHTAYDFLYLTVQLFVLQSGWVQGSVNWQLQLARFLAPAATVYAAVVGIAALFRDQFQSLMARFLRNHVVISGLGRRGSLLAQRFLEKGHQVIALERDQGNERINEFKARGGIVLIGDASDVELLRSAGVDRAHCLIAVSGDDGVNAEIAVHARALVRERKSNPLTCAVQIDDLDLCRVLRGHELHMGRPEAFRLEFFNSYLIGAKALLEKHPPFDETRDPNIMVLGVGRFGESLATRMAWAWREKHRASGQRLVLKLVDKTAVDRKRLLLLRNPFLETICDLQAIPMDVRSPEFLEGGFLFNDAGLCELTRIYVCLDNDSLSVSTALALLKRLSGHKIPIVTRMSREGGVGVLLHSADETREGFGYLSVFGTLEQTCVPELVLGGTQEFLAQAICAEYLDLESQESAADTATAAVTSWEKVPDDIKDLYRRLAGQIGRMLGQIGCTVEPLSEWNAEQLRFDPEEQETLAASIHDFYLKEHRRGGAKYLPTLRAVSETQEAEACTWEQCPEQAKDVYRDIVRMLPAFLGKVDFQVYRLNWSNGVVLPR